MPELPEVEVVRAGLAPAVTGGRVLAVRVEDQRALTRHSGTSDDFVTRLTGRTLAGAVRRGKFLWMPLDDSGSGPEALVAHLGMSGQLLLTRGNSPRKHRRVVITEQPRLVDQNGEPEGPVDIEFVDQRTFGSLAIDAMVPTSDGHTAGWSPGLTDQGHDVSWRTLIPTQVAHIARDPLDPAFDDERFVSLARKRSSGIKRVLLDQTVISGIGNIYADEALWAARLHGDRPADRLSRRALTNLLEELRGVLRRALEDGGTSFDAQYVNVNGQSGYFAQRLNVYGRGGSACPRCGNPIVREAFMTRSSHRCPVCQPRTRAIVR